MSPTQGTLGKSTSHIAKIGNGKRSAEALERRAIRKAQRIAIKNEIAKEQIVEESWICPNMDCKNVNYQRRMECNMC